MKIERHANFTKGWFIGNFEPTLLKTEDFEVAVHYNKKGQYIAPHTHKVATEYNMVISGHMSIQGIPLRTGDIFVIDPNDIADPVFYEDTVVLIVKTPSIIGDKYELV